MTVDASSQNVGHRGGQILVARPTLYGPCIDPPAVLRAATAGRMPCRAANFQYSTYRSTPWWQSEIMSPKIRWLFPDFFMKIPGPIFQNSLTVSKNYQSLISNLGFATQISWVSQNRRFSEQNSIMEILPGIHAGQAQNRGFSVEHVIFEHQTRFRKFHREMRSFRTEVWFCEIYWNFLDFSPKVAKFPDFAPKIGKILWLFPVTQNSLTFPDFPRFSLTLTTLHTT